MNEYQFRKVLNETLTKVKRILDTERNPQSPADVPHTYNDKFALAEICVKGAIASQLNILDVLGLTANHHGQIRKWMDEKLAVTARFDMEESCAFDRETKRDVESATKYVKETQSAFGSNKTKETHKVITTVTEYFYRFNCQWSIRIYAGPDPKRSDTIVLRSRSYRHEIKTTTKSMPRPSKKVHTPKEVDLTWLFSMYDKKAKGYAFTIDRSDAKTCRTPRRNPDVERALVFFANTRNWLKDVHTLLLHNYNSLVVEKNKPQMQDNRSTLNVVAAVFAFEKPETSTKTSVLYSDADYAKFMKEHERSMRDNLDVASKLFANESDQNAVYSSLEAMISYVYFQTVNLHNTIVNAVNQIEQYLRNQVIAAIGKTVQPSDFAEYMDFHCSRLLREPYRPRPFCYAVRRPGQFPQGTVSVENASSNNAPVRTMVMTGKAHPMTFPLNAATNVRFGGDRFLHATVLHQFSGSAPPSLQLVARARQFSSFILLVGKIADATTFAPESAMIVKNKDDLRIPLMLETMPTPKEFRDAIESLSPEQQRFCKAWRKMKLASSVFAVCVIEIKPQMEKVLNLSPGALTKEIALTQGLSKLFIEYQIPPDLLSFDGDKNTSEASKLRAVQDHHDAIVKVIDAEKQKEIEEEKKRAAKAMALEMERLKNRKEISFSDDEDDEVEEVELMMCGADFGGGGADLDGAVEEAFAGEEVLEEASDKNIIDCDGDEPCEGKSDGLELNDTLSEEKPGQAQTNDKTKPLSLSSNQGTSISPREKRVIDYTKIPAALDKKYEALDEDSALRPTTLKVFDTWTHKSQDGLLSKPSSRYLNIEEQTKERNAAFDLLDALTRSGALSVECASLHVVVAATHCFDKSVMNTIVQDNVNPIEKVERSQLIMLSAIYDKPVSALIESSQVNRVLQYSPMLIESERRDKK